MSELYFNEFYGTSAGAPSPNGFFHAIEGLDVQVNLTRAIDYGSGDYEETGRLGEVTWPDEDLAGKARFNFVYTYQLIFRRTDKPLAPGTHSVRVATLSASTASQSAAPHTQNIYATIAVPPAPTCSLVKNNLRFELATAKTADFADLPVGGESKIGRRFAIPLDCTGPPVDIKVTFTDRNPRHSSEYFHLASHADAASGLGLKIRAAATNTTIRTGEPIVVQGPQSAAGPHDVEFSVNYVKIAKQVTAGEVRAGVEFTLSYQ